MNKLDQNPDETLPVQQVEVAAAVLAPRVEVAEDTDFGSMPDAEFNTLVERISSPDSELGAEEKMTQLVKIKSELGALVDAADAKILRQRQSLGGVRANLNLPEQNTTDDAGSTEIRRLIDFKKKVEGRLEKIEAILTGEKVKGENSDQEQLNQKKTQESLFYCFQLLRKLDAILQERAGDNFDSMIDDRGFSAMGFAKRNLEQISSGKEIDPTQLIVAMNALYEGLDAFGRVESGRGVRDTVDSLTSMANVFRSAHEGVEKLKQSLILSGDKYLDSIDVLKKLGDEVIPARYNFLAQKINIANNEYLR